MINEYTIPRQRDYSQSAILGEHVDILKMDGHLRSVDINYLLYQPPIIQRAPPD